MTRKGRYRGQRALRIGARTLHLIGMAVFVGSVLHGRPHPGALMILMVSGAWIVADDLYRYGADWLRFVQGWAVLAKMALLLVALAAPSMAPAALIGAIVIGGVVSHAPGRVRQAALWGAPGPCAARDRLVDGSQA